MLFSNKELVNGAVITKALEYANDLSANYVIQAILRKCCSEFESINDILRANSSGGLLLPDDDSGDDAFDSLPKKERKTFKTLIRISTLLLSELLDEVKLLSRIFVFVLFIYYYLLLFIIK